MAADGTWHITLETPMGARASTLNFRVEGGSLKGTQAADGNSTNIKDGTANGDQVSWKVDIQDPLPLTLTFSGTVEGDKISGQADTGQFGSFPFSGSRA